MTDDIPAPIVARILALQRERDGLRAALQSARMVIGALIIDAGGAPIKVSHKALVEVDRDGVLNSLADFDGVFYAYHSRAKSPQHESPLNETFSAGSPHPTPTKEEMR